MNKWNIPEPLEKEIRARDKKCVYCGVRMMNKKPKKCSYKNIATWEHIINDATIITRDNIVRCCSACNSSKGAKSLVDWFNSPYCINKNINTKTVTGIVKKHLQKGEKYI